jgi:hypothetical protein
VQYLQLGPTRTMQRVRDDLCEERGKQSYRCGGHWSKAAQKWRWQERTRAWDIDQAQQYAAMERTTAVALHVRRLEILEEGLDMCMDLLRAARLDELTPKEARAMFPQTSRFLVKLLREERIECESWRDWDDKRTNEVIITADDLRAAQRELQRRLTEERALLPPPAEAT